MLSLRRAITIITTNSNTILKPPTLHFSTYSNHASLPHAPPPQAPPSHASPSHESPDDAPPTSAYFDELINTAGRNRDYATVKKLLNKRARLACSNTTSTFKFISSDPSILDELLPYFATLNSNYPRKGAYNCLIAHLSRRHETHKAMRVAGEMAKHESMINAASFHPILSSATKRKEMEEAWRVVELMRYLQVHPDINTYNYFLNAYCLVGDLGSAGEVLEKIREEGLRENEKTYDALVLGACGTGKMDAGLLLIRRMVDEGITPVYNTYLHVIGGFCRDGYYAEALEFVRMFVGIHGKVDSLNYGMLGARLVGLQRFDEAKVVVEEMAKRNIPMDRSLRKFYELHFASSE